MDSEGQLCFPTLRRRWTADIALLSKRFRDRHRTRNSFSTHKPISRPTALAAVCRAPRSFVCRALLELDRADADKISDRAGHLASLPSCCPKSAARRGCLHFCRWPGFSYAPISFDSSPRALRGAHGSHYRSRKESCFIGLQRGSGFGGFANG